MELAQLVCDRRVALRVTEADRRGDVERALAARLAAHPTDGRRRRDELAQEEVDLDRIADVRCVAGAFEENHLPPVCSARAIPRVTEPTRVVLTVDDQHRDSGRAAPARVPRPAPDRP